MLFGQNSRTPPDTRITDVKCVDGFADIYPCKNVDLLSYVPITELGSFEREAANDIWGWTDPSNDREYALICVFDGLSVVDVTVATDPQPVAFVPGGRSMWHDVKVFKNHAYIGSEAKTNGIQVFDLTRVRGIKSGPPRIMEADVVYKEITSSHNVVINEESGTLFVVGSKTCNGGLHMVDIREPKKPAFLGCYDENGYIHDAECHMYDGPDERYTGRELCWAYNRDKLTLVDVTDKKAPKTLSTLAYSRVGYTHQGWATPDKKYVLLDDELDEIRGQEEITKFTRTLLIDISDLENQKVVGTYTSSKTAIDHNLYTLGHHAYQSNYGAGLRILNTKAVVFGAAAIYEEAYFDVAPESDDVKFTGAWSNYPYFKSGNIIVSSIERGLFVLKPNLN